MASTDSIRDGLAHPRSLRASLDAVSEGLVKLEDEIGCLKRTNNALSQEREAAKNKIEQLKREVEKRSQEAKDLKKSVRPLTLVLRTPDD